MVEAGGGLSGSMAVGVNLVVVGVGDTDAETFNVLNSTVDGFVEELSLALAPCVVAFRGESG